MPLIKTDLQEISKLLDDKLDKQHSVIILDVKTLIRQELEPLKARVDQLYKLVHDDVGLAFKEIETLKKRIKKLEVKVGILNR